MEVQDYCGAMSTELTAWKAKVYDVVRKLDKLETEGKGKILSNVEDMHMLIEDLGQRIDKLNKECPTEWNPQRQEIEGKMTNLRDNWQAVWGQVAAGDIGG
jgi:hypothetical protein